jgi:hypothetical protein
MIKRSSTPEDFGGIYQRSHRHSSSPHGSNTWILYDHLYLLTFLPKCGFESLSFSTYWSTAFSIINAPTEDFGGIYQRSHRHSSSPHGSNTWILYAHLCLLTFLPTCGFDSLSFSDITCIIDKIEVGNDPKLQTFWNTKKTFLE